MIADILMHDREDRPFLVVEVKARPIAPADLQEILDERLRSPYFVVPYGMVVDPEKIRIFDLASSPSPQPILTLETRATLRHYDPRLRRGVRVSEDYLETLTGAWLRDLAHGWKSKSPPGRDELADTGLLERLEGGATQTEVPIGGHLVR